MHRHSFPAILLAFLAGTAPLFGLAEEKLGPDTLKKLTVPDTIILHNEIEGSTLKGTATKPTRKVWHARVDFDDASPAADFEHDLATRITLWEKNHPVPIALGGVSHEGKFHAAFSDTEFAALKSGDSWLTPPE